MKTVKFTTTRETAAVLKELASNNGTSFSVGSRSRADFEAHRNHPHFSQPASFIRDLEAARATPVEQFMTGEVQLPDGIDPTPAAILHTFENGRRLRAKTIAKLVGTIQIER